MTLSIRKHFNLLYNPLRPHDAYIWGNYVIVVLDNDLPPVWRPATTWTNADLIGMNFGETNKIQQNHFTKNVIQIVVCKMALIYGAGVKSIKVIKNAATVAVSDTIRFTLIWFIRLTHCLIVTDYTISTILFGMTSRHASLVLWDWNTLFIGRSSTENAQYGTLVFSFLLARMNFWTSDWVVSDQRRHGGDMTSLYLFIMAI